MRHREAQSACFNKLVNALKPAGHRGGVTKVELKVDGQTVAYTEKNGVEHETMKRNRDHFNSAAGTPFTVYPLSDVGASEKNFKTSHLPDSTKIRMPPGTFLETETLLDLLRTPLPGTATLNISAHISLEDFTNAIKAWKKRTKVLRHQGGTWAITSSL